MNDEFEGYGEYIDTLGNKYEGEFLQSKKNGMGKYKMANGDYYVGNFLSDEYHHNG